MKQEDMDDKRSMTGSSDFSILHSPICAQSFPTNNAWSNHDTIHYLSPVTTARTQYEGDFLYQHFQPYLHHDLPQFTSTSSISCEEIHLQRTLAIIKPEAMVYTDVVLKTIQDRGFSIINQRTVHLTPEQAAEVYAQYYGCPAFPNMVLSISVGPLLVLSLQGLNAVEKWKSLVGDDGTLSGDWFVPVNIRRRFGLRLDMPQVLHASENTQEAAKNNRYFFPQSVLEPIINDDDKVEDFCNLYINSTLLIGLTELVKKKPLEPIIFLAEWLLINNPFQPSVPYNYAMTPT